MPLEQAKHLLIDAYDSVLKAYALIGYPTQTDENFRDTAERAAKAALEMVRPVGEIEREIDELLNNSYPAQYDQMVVSKHNICFGLCPHHLLPAIYRISVAYLPSDRVVGISKLSRLIRLLCKRPVLQEDLTHELSEILWSRLSSRGAGVHIEGMHLCMAARGVFAHEARLVTSAMRGLFAEQSSIRQEFLNIVAAPPLGPL